MVGGPHSPNDATDLHASQEPSARQDALVREGSTFMTDPEAEKFCQTFADGLESGIGYSRILDILGRQGFDKKTITRLRSALLEHGDLLGEALARYGILDPAARKLILVADEQGVLPQTFKHLGTIYGKRYKRKREFAVAMVEPLILIALGLIVFRNIIGHDIVKLAFSNNLHEQLKHILISSGLESCIFGLVCFVGFFTWFNLPVDFAPRDLFGRIWLRMPVLSDPGKLFAVSLFCRYLAQAIDSGMTVYQGLELAAEASNHPGILGGYKKAQAAIEDGYSLAQALYSVRLLPAEVLENVDIGEESGRLDERLEFLSKRYEEKSVEAFRNRMNAYTWIVRYGIIVLVVSLIFISISKMHIFRF